jgi:hypothetical protein
MTATTGRRLTALALAALALSAAGCSSSDSATRAAATTAASHAPRAYATDPGKGGPCRATMNHISDVGRKITADAKDRAKAAADLQEAGDQFTADADGIKNPEAKQAAKQLGSVYHDLAAGAKDNRSPDLKTLPGKVQSAVSALSKCAAAE